jgi:allantoicase
VGARVITVSNQLFARAENLLSPFEPVFDPELFGLQGKIMDSWETVRHNPEFDELQIELQKPGVVRYLDLSTKYHTGNHAPLISLCGKLDGDWVEILAPTKMEGHSLLSIDLQDQAREYRYVRIRLFPDGGFTRLGLYADLPESVRVLYEPLSTARPIRFTDLVPQTKKPMSLDYHVDPQEIEKNKARLRDGLVDLASAAFGGEVMRVTNQHYGPATHVISPFAPLNMFDGFETARNRNPLNVEEVEIKIAKSSKIDHVEIDFTYFVNNNPRELAVQIKVGESWIELIQKCSVKPFAGGRVKFPVPGHVSGEIIKVQAYPCGGFNRVHIYGKLL